MDGEFHFEDEEIVVVESERPKKKKGELEDKYATLRDPVFMCKFLTAYAQEFSNYTYLKVPKTADVSDLLRQRTEEVLKVFCDLLTFTPKTSDYISGKKDPRIFCAAQQQTKDAVYLQYPRFFFFAQQWWKADWYNEIVLPKTTLNSGIPFSERAIFVGELKCHQKVAVATIADRLLGEGRTMSGGGAVAVLPCGCGKTVIGLAVAACHVRRRTLILVQQNTLVEQWKERIRQFVPGAKIGTLQQDICEVDNCDFVVGMVHSVAGRDYPSDVVQSFGFLLVDECHHMAARFFSQAIPKIPARCILGLTATPERGDGLDPLLFLYMGQIAYELKERDLYATPKVLRLVYSAPNPELQEKEVHLRGKKDKLNTAVMMNNLVDIKLRQDRYALVFDILCAILETAPSRAILVLSHRIHHLTTLYKAAVDHFSSSSTLAGKVKCGLFIGTTAPQEREEMSKTCTILFGTYHIASEGLDIPRLDTIVLCTPVKNVTQPVGRILRYTETKQWPLIVDLCDKFSYYEKLSYSRLHYYRSQKYYVRSETVPSPFSSKIFVDMLQTLANPSSKRICVQEDDDIYLIDD